MTTYAQLYQDMSPDEQRRLQMWIRLMGRDPDHYDEGTLGYIAANRARIVNPSDGAFWPWPTRFSGGGGP